MNAKTKKLLKEYYAYLEQAHADKLPTIAKQAQTAYNDAEQILRALVLNHGGNARLVPAVFQDYVERSIELRKQAPESYEIQQLELVQKGDGKPDWQLVLHPESPVKGPREYVFPASVGLGQAVYATLEAFQNRLRLNEARAAELDTEIHYPDEVGRLFGAFQMERDHYMDKVVQEYLIQQKKLEQKEKEVDRKIKELEQKEKELAKRKSQPVRMASHLVEQATKPRTLFSSLEEEGLDNVNVEDTVAASILNDLKAAELKIVIALNTLLDRKSPNTTQPDKPGYYIGSEKIQTADKTYSYTAALYVTLYEITQEYTGRAKPGGADIKEVERILEGLAAKEFQIKYTRTILDKKGKAVSRQTIDQKRPILFIDQAKAESLADGKSESFKVIQVHPIFIDQIASKYINYPPDIMPRLREAFVNVTGSSREHEETLKLLLYLSHVVSNKHYTHFIYLSNLLLKLNESAIKQRKKGRVLERLEASIQVLKELGLILEATQETGKTGELGYSFTLAKDWA